MGFAGDRIGEFRWEFETHDYTWSLAVGPLSGVAVLANIFGVLNHSREQTPDIEPNAASGREPGPRCPMHAAV